MPQLYFVIDFMDYDLDYVIRQTEVSVAQSTFRFHNPALLSLRVGVGYQDHF